MSIHAVSQQIPENSTTMWSQPSTDEQRAYYSKHAPKRRVYGLFMTGLQITHGALAFAAWFMLLSLALSKIPFLLPAAPWLAGGILIICHVLFRVTWDTYFYDRLDDNEETDSSIWIPVAILLLLLFTEVKGAQKYLANLVETPKVTQTVGVDQNHSTTIASMEKQYQNDVKSIREVYAEKEKAAALPYDRQIKSWKNRRAESHEAQRDRANNIATLERQRDAALAPVLQAKANALESALNAYIGRKSQEEARRDTAVVAIETGNKKELSRFDADMGDTYTYSWLISVVLLGLIAALGYARVRINVKSGILPLRNYTVLDAHGSALERIWTALADAFNRRSLQLAVSIHRGLSPNKAITSFDGTIVAKPGTYNTPAGFHPTPPASKPIDQAVIEVTQKIEAIKRSNPGFTPSPDDYIREMDLAMKLNGSYPGHPFQGDVGKASTPSAEARTSGVSMTAPTPYTEACQTVSDRLSEYEPGKTPSMPLLIANIDKWIARARQCWRRAHPDNTEVKSPEKQYENQNKAEKYAAVINCFGYTVEWKNGPHPSDHEVIFHSLNWSDDRIRANVEKNWAPMYNTLEYLGEIKTAKQPADLL